MAGLRSASALFSKKCRHRRKHGAKGETVSAQFFSTIAATLFQPQFVDPSSGRRSSAHLSHRVGGNFPPRAQRHNSCARHVPTMIPRWSCGCRSTAPSQTEIAAINPETTILAARADAETANAIDFSCRQIDDLVRNRLGFLSMAFDPVGRKDRSTIGTFFNAVSRRAGFRSHRNLLPTCLSKASPSCRHRRGDARVSCRGPVENQALQRAKAVTPEHIKVGGLIDGNGSIIQQIFASGPST